MKSDLTKSILTFIIISFFTSVSAENDVCRKINNEAILKNIPVSDFKILSTREIEGICEVIININDRVIPLYGNENFLVSGDLFKNRQNITKDMIYNVNRKAFLDIKKNIDDIVAFEYRPKEIKSEKVVYMFTEPLCPYCHKAGSEVKNLADRYGFTVKVLLVSMKGEEGKRKCIEAACRNFIFKEKFNLEQYNQLEWKKEKPDEQFICEKGAALIKKTEEISNRLYIDGIPVFYLNNGDYISGAEMNALEQLIKSK